MSLCILWDRKQRIIIASLAIALFVRPMAFFSACRVNNTYLLAKKRRHVIKEILETEKTYVESLLTITNVFHNPLQKVIG